jgi:hypothetical protein
MEVTRKAEGVRAVALLALASALLFAQFQAAWATPKARPERAHGRSASFAPHGKALGYYRKASAAAVAPTVDTVPLGSTPTTIPPAVDAVRERGRVQPSVRTSAKVTPRKGKGSTGRTGSNRGTITIKKDAVPDSSDTWHFSGDLGNFSLRDEVGLSFSDLKAGTYAVTEKKKAGWKVDHIVCGDPTAGASIQDQGRTITIALPPGGDTTCTFVGKKSKTSGHGNGPFQPKHDKNRNSLGSKSHKDGKPSVKPLPFTGFQPDWFLFSAGMLLIAGGVLLRPQGLAFDL